VTDPISPEDHALIEQTRKVNKTLSLFVFALQERSDIATESQTDIADMLTALAETVRARAANRAAERANARLLLDRAAAPLQIEASRESTDILDEHAT